MSQTKVVLDLTDNLSEAIDTHDSEEALKVAEEIQHYLDTHSVEDAAYYDAVDRLKELTTILDTDDITSEQWVKVGAVATQIDELYLRHHREQDNSQQSVDKIQTERDAFREKSIRYAQDINEFVDLFYDLTDTIEMLSRGLEDCTSKLEDCTSKLEDKNEVQKKRIDRIASDLLGSDDDDIIQRLEEAKDQLEHGDNQDAEEIIADTRDKIESGEYYLTGYPTIPFVSRLQMAESDAKLGRTTVLENLLLDYKNESDLDR